MAAPEEEFQRFFQDNCEQLVALAYLWCGDRQEARDLAQETLTRTWERWESVCRHPNPEAWARRVLHNLCVSHWRRRRLERLASASRSSTRSAPRSTSPDETAMDVVALLARLAPKPRRALVLHDVIGLTVEEIAREMGAREGTVRSWLAFTRSSATPALGRGARLARQHD